MLKSCFYLPFIVKYEDIHESTRYFGFTILSTCFLTLKECLSIEILYLDENKNKTQIKHSLFPFNLFFKITGMEWYFEIRLIYLFLRNNTLIYVNVQKTNFLKRVIP